MTGVRRRDGTRNVARPRVAVMALALAMVCAVPAGCATSGFNRDVFRATQDALVAVREAEPGLLDPDLLHDAARAATAGASQGVRLSPELQGDAARLVEGVVNAALAALQPALERLLAMVRAQLVALLDGTDGPLARLTAHELQIVRRELRGAVDDLDVSLQRLIQHNARVFADELRTSVGPALDDTVVSTLRQGSREVGANLTSSVGRGVRRDIVPAIRDAESALLGRDEQSKRRDQLVAVALGIAVVGLLVVIAQNIMASRHSRELTERMLRLLVEREQDRERERRDTSRAWKDT